MWPESKEDLAARMKTVHERATHYNRTLDYGLRVHMIVRDTEQEAREYAQELVSQLDDEAGKAIRERALDSTSLEWLVKRATASWLIWRVLLNRIYGQVLDALVLAVVLR